MGTAMQYELSLTKEDVSGATPRDVEKCPIARCGKRMIPDCKDFTVGSCVGHLHTNIKWFKAKLPPRVVEYIGQFDTGLNPPLISFTLDFQEVI